MTSTNEINQSFIEFAEAVMGREMARPSHERIVTSFQDARIAGLQAIVDYIFSMGGKYPNPVSADITEFFLAGEPFNTGYQITEQIIGPSLVSKVKPNKTEEMTRLITGFEQASYGIVTPEFKKSLDSLLERSISKASMLLNGTYLKSENPDNEFQGQNVIVTGSNTGIGRAVALEFARRGAKVVLHYSAPGFARGALSAQEMVLESSGEAKIFQGDFRKTEEIFSFADQSAEYLGKVDVIVNNAGITLNKAFDKTTPEDFDSLFSVNVKGAYFLTQKMLPYLNKKARIINLSSNHGVRGMAGYSVYASTKAAIAGLTRVLAMELSPITVNSISPGWVAGVNHFKLSPEVDFNDEGKKQVPNGRIARPDEFAKNVVWLASKGSMNVTGQDIASDGGLSIGMYCGNSCTMVSDKEWGKQYLK
ncbi:SDR family oxidoreductase [Candidatus Woesearchaeota archaeon]|nr:SDR family oxidoreductase [Candidatus Woesearchaeota archaeon]